MSDLVERLRAWHAPNETITGDVQLYLDAAARIEALEAALMTEWAARDNRIEALEAALREITFAFEATENAAEKMYFIAAEALAPEQEK